MYNQTPLPGFTGLFRQRQFFTRQLCLVFWLYLLLISLGRWGLLVWSVLGWCNCLSSEDGEVPLAEDSWMELLAWFPTQVRLQDGLFRCLDSLVRLTGGSRLVLYTVINETMY